MSSTYIYFNILLRNREELYLVYVGKNYLRSLTSSNMVLNC